MNITWIDLYVIFTHEKPNDKWRVVAKKKQASVQDSGHDVVPYNPCRHGRRLLEGKNIRKGGT